MFSEEEISRIPYRRGPISARLAMVGEAPGEQEVADPLKRPFVGGSGQLLEAIMRQTGIDPSTVYFSNIIKERPEEKEIHAWIKNHPNNYSVYLQLLNQELGSLPNLQMIVPVGATAIDAICNKKSIENWRGSIIPATLPSVKGKKCVGIVHPAAILRQWLYRPATVIDMARIKEEMEFPELNLPVREYVIDPTFEQVLDEISDAKKSPDLLSVDIETLPHPQRMSLFQFCISAKRAIAILFQHRDGRSVWTEDQELIILKALIDLLENCGRRIIGQNILTFDFFMLMLYGFNIEKLLANVWMDLMEAFECIEPQLPRGLDFLTSVYTREPFYKTEGKEWGTKQGEEEFKVYGCKDVLVVHEIVPQVYQELVEEKLLDFYYDRFQGLAWERLQMTRRGLLIDEKKRKELKIQFTRDIVIDQAKLNVLTGHNLNVSSHKQMANYLYDELKLPKQWKNGKVTCDEDAILTLSTKYPGEAFRLILSQRNKRNLFSNNIEARKDSDGRIRCSFGFAETGRFRSYECPLGSGGNLQNWTPSMRVMVVPDPGKVLVECDLSQAEARVVAYAGHIKYMLDVFVHDPNTIEGDIHRHTASIIFEMALDTITKESDERYAAKRIVHASDYGMHANTFSKRFNKDAADSGHRLISITEAAGYLGKYHEKVPELRSGYHRWIQDQVRATKLLFNPYGRRMKFHDRIGEDLYRAGYAWYAQSTVTDIINTILKVIAKTYDVWLQVHDSILACCWPHEIPSLIALIKASNPVIIVGGMSLQIPIGIKVSTISWLNMEDYKEQIAA
jgi:uracil-DNA glycosylase family 4